ncbi:FAD-dependent oxidoreductase [Cellulomonas sp.]|uniref:FAD-dependent oxidoreductase n=1 Tax=Cellulomonas sp. TaxID=40001 RepID=UPI002810F443|nr:FAD-dependent oxidoreductase [Cellulomonas sp.]
MGPVDRLLGAASMYRVTTVVLLAVHAWAAGLGALGVLDVDPVALVVTVAVCLAAVLLTSLLGHALGGVRPHVESSVLTALLLGLLLWPDASPAGLASAGLAGAAAGLTKVLVRYGGRHVANPAAAGALVLGLASAALGGPGPVWWAATPLMAPVVVPAGLAVVRRCRAEAVALAAVGTYVVLVVPRLVASGVAPGDALATVLLSHPVVLAACFMVVEPLTQAPRRHQRVAVAVLVGAAAGVPFAAGPLSTSPELAIVLGNVVTAVVTRPRAVRLEVVRHGAPAPGTHEVVLRPARPLPWRPGQWVELDVGQLRPDGRGRRRTLSIVPAGDGLLAVAFALPARPSAFKAALAAAPVGATVRATAVGGDFLLPRDRRVPLLLVAGGVGITPFVAHLDDAGDRDVVLVVVAGRGVLPPYATRIAATGARVLVVSPVPVVGLPDGWRWYAGSRLTAAALAAATSDLPRRHAYVSGAPDLVHRARRLLAAAGVRRVRTDAFTGYDRRPAHALRRGRTRHAGRVPWRPARALRGAVARWRVDGPSATAVTDAR